MLATNDLTIGYGKKAIQSHLNLQAKARDLICLVGTNGAGKSTLLRTLAGLQKPLAGNITIQEQNIQKLSNHQRSLLYSMVLTDPIAVDNLTVYDLVALGRIPYTDWRGALTKADNELIEQAIAQVNLSHKRDEYLNAISDGEKQRAVIAKALAQNTPLVLLDEPTAHLDLPNRIEIMLLLRRLSVNTQKTFILSTHELDLALQMADTIWLMTDHQVEVGIPEDLMLTGKFQQAFGNTSYHFDENDGHCRIHHLCGPLQVTVEGKNPGMAWMSRALMRCGIQIVDTAPIVIQTDGYHFKMGHQEFDNIDHVLKHILKN